MAEFPNFYSTAHLMSATSCQWAGSTWAYDELSFGFIATSLRIVNTCGDPLYYGLKAGSLTTRDAYIAGCSPLQIDGGIRAVSLSLMTTSSSSTSRPRIAVSAWASA